jgi:acyl-CoA reductase-like NAD-dependent aldehyde dehydrogenase
MNITAATAKEVKAKFQLVTSSQQQGLSLPYEWRLTQLKQLRALVSENESIFVQAFAQDLGRCEFEALVLDCLPIVAEIDDAIANLRGWMRPEAVNTPIGMLPATSEIVKQPYGVSLIIGAFNYPLNLLCVPLCGAISAGCCSILKPSEQSMAIEKVLYELIPKYLDSKCIQVVCGGVATTQSLLNDCIWGKIFFTGSPRVGKIVMKAASEHLTSVTLELGGKSPVIIDKTCTNLYLASRRIMWAKCSNTGQTCIAPDYVLCHSEVYEQFLAECQSRILEFYCSNGVTGCTKSDFGRIISKEAAQRLVNLIDSIRDQATIISGGEHNVEDRYVAPTIIRDVILSSPLLKEEIFGPLLPVIKIVETTDMSKNKPFLHQVQDHIQSIGANPLAMYIFSKDKTFINEVIHTVSSGGVVVNDCTIHYANTHLPFGGVGSSGVGMAHGYYNFLAFTHQKAVMRRHDSYWTDIPQRYPPYDNISLAVLRLNFKLGAFPPLATYTKLIGSVLLFKAGEGLLLLALEYMASRGVGWCAIVREYWVSLSSKLSLTSVQEMLK